jgi:hypothetical protein
MVLFFAVVALAARRRLTLRGVAWAALGTGATLGASLLVVAAGWTMYRTAYEERVWTGTGVVISDWYRLGLVLLSAAVVLGIYAGLLRRLRAWDLAVAALAWWAAGSVVIALAFPGASYLLTWSLVGGSLGLAGAALVDRPAAGRLAGDLPMDVRPIDVRPADVRPADDRPADVRPADVRPADVRPAAALIALAGAVPGLTLLSSAVYLLLMSAGLKQSVTVVAVWLLAGLLMLPLAGVLHAFRFWLPAALAVAGIVVLFAVGSTVAFDSEHPKFTSVSYRQGPDGATTWESVERVDDYTRGFLGESPSGQLVPEYYPRFGPQAISNAPAPAYGLGAPSVKVLSDITDGDRRTVVVRLRSERDAAVLSLLVHTVVGSLSASVDGMELGGRDTTLLDASNVRWSFDFYAPPTEGVVVTLDFAAGPGVRLRAVDFTYGLPAGAAGSYPARPAGMLPGRLGDGTLTETLVRLPATAH